MGEDRLNRIERIRYISGRGLVLNDIMPLTMDRFGFVVLPLLAASALSGQTLKSILLDQLRSTHNKAEWFVPVNTAVEGLTAKQAKWTDSSGNHSAGQLAAHLLFWDARELARFRGNDPGKFTGKNDETFDNNFDAKRWAETVRKLDQVSDLEKFVESADDATIQKYASDLAHIGAHNCSRCSRQQHRRAMCRRASSLTGYRPLGSAGGYKISCWMSGASQSSFITGLSRSALTPAGAASSA